MEKFIVIGYRKADRAYGLTRALFEVHVEKGETTKDVQDKVAETAAQRPDIIYTVVPEADYRAIFRAIVDQWVRG
jgi:hypothetical protein